MKVKKNYIILCNKNIFLLETKLILFFFLVFESVKVEMNDMRIQECFVDTFV